MVVELSGGALADAALLAIASVATALWLPAFWHHRLAYLCGLGAAVLATIVVWVTHRVGVPIGTTLGITIVVPVIEEAIRVSVVFLALAGRGPAWK